MNMLFIMLVVALAASSIGFKKYVWFISLGYGGAVAAIGIALLIIYGSSLSPALIILTGLLIIYGCRLGGYLAFRELKSASYNRTMKKEIKDGKDISIPVKCAIWISAALLYVCQTSPVLFRLKNGSGSDLAVIIGVCVMIFGLLFESAADLQKNKAKKKNPNRFVDTGLFRIVRCPNYLGEMLFWTGVFLSGVTTYQSAAQWVVALIGYLGIIYVMFGGARRLEIRQNRNYGNDPEYQTYVKTVPIMVPFIPLYSVEKYKWLVA